SLLQDEYDRGAEEALKRIVDVAQGADRRRGPRKTNKQGRRLRRPQKPHAPRGSARALVERVLSENGSSSASQIVAAAKSAIEKSLSTSAIRLELTRGKKERRYRVSDGRWSVSKAKASSG